MRRGEKNLLNEESRGLWRGEERIVNEESRGLRGEVRAAVGDIRGGGRVRATVARRQLDRQQSGRCR